jgi:hypothetical protein
VHATSFDNSGIQKKLSLTSLQAPQANGKAVATKDEEQATQRLLKDAEEVCALQSQTLSAQNVV